MRQPHGPIRSFWIGGFEGADHLNASALPLDMAVSTGHIARLDHDYAAAAERGLRTVRESVGWRLCEPAPRRYALQRAQHIARTAQRHGVQVLWTVMHYGTPADVDLFDDALIDRFAGFAAAVARALGPLSDIPPVYTPINEIGFLAWAVSETSRFWPYHHGGAQADDSTRSGYAVKRRLARAALAGMAAIRDVDPRARFLHVEPLVHVVAPDDRPDLQPLAEQVAGYQWQAWDLIAGRLEPSLGGSPALLDLVGVNHYHSGQWEVGTERRLDWHLNDPRRRAPSRLLGAAWERYGRPLVIAETSHVGDGRAAWLEDMAGHAAEAIAAGVPLLGLCLYPLIDRPDWDEPARWHRSGLFDVVPASPADASLHGAAWRRVPDPAYAAALVRWQARLPLLQDTAMPVIIVFSHLRWGFVYQRPQQLMARLARDHRIVFVEEPSGADGPPRLEHHRPLPGVEVLCPVTGLDAAGFNDAQIARITPLLAAWLAREGISHPIAWLYTPMALPLVDVLQPCAVVYDCMDELSAFRGAPATLVAWEAQLMKLADLVFTGGPSLYEARKGQHAALHCLPSSVDAAHFSPARLLPDSREAEAAGELHRGIGRPRLGFYGVIDERLDIALVAALADADPHWHVVMTGPVVKIDPATLPRRPNLHWIGMQPYAVLPYLAAAWDVCLLPFALNESTRFISPTKTLEYMASDKPVVSTAVRDVAVLYGDAVRIADDTDGFVQACRDALCETPEARAGRRSAMQKIVSRVSWDDSVDRVRRWLVPLLQARACNPPGPPARQQAA